MAPKSNAIMAYQPPLTPVSEVESDTTEAASMTNATTSSATSTASVQSYFRRPLNFSRPRPVDFSPEHRVHHDRSDSCGSAIPLVHSLDAFDAERSSLPDTPSFAIQFDDEKEVVPAERDFSWEDHLKDMKPAKRYIDYDGQRSQPRRLYQPEAGSLQQQDVQRPRSADAQRHDQTSRTTNARPHNLQRSKSTNTPDFVPQAKAATTALPKPPQKIVEDPQEADWDGEDVASHHTVSENEETTERPTSSWTSSSHNVDAFNEKEIKKLRKKGINPALYAEMKAAKQGKGRWINVLSGNAYLS